MEGGAEPKFSFPPNGNAILKESRGNALEGARLQASSFKDISRHDVSEFDSAQTFEMCFGISAAPYTVAPKLTLRMISAA